MKNVHKGLGVKNMSDLILKEIYSIYETKNLTKEQIRKYKMTEREIFEIYDNLTEDELSNKSNNNVYVKNDVMTAVIKRCIGEKKRRKTDLEKNWRFQNLKFESEISQKREISKNRKYIRQSNNI